MATPKTQIPPFAAEGSSAPSERYLHPSAFQKIMEAVAVALTGAGQGLQGNPLAGAQLAQAFQARREQAAQNPLINSILTNSMQLGQTPDTIPPPNLPSMQFGLGDIGAQASPAPEQANPAYQDLIDKILRGAQQFSQMGGSPDVLANVLTKTGALQDPIAKRQADLEALRQKNRMAQEGFKQGQVNQRAKEKNIITGRLANSLISYREGGTPQQAKNVLLDLNQQLRLELNDYYDTVKDFPMIQATAMASGFPPPPPPVMPTLEGVAANAGYDLNDLKRKVGGGGKKNPPPPPAVGDPAKKQKVVNELWAKFQKANKKWINPKDKELWDTLRGQGISPQ